MSFVTEPVQRPGRPLAAGATATDWLDALAQGECDQQSFMEGVDEALRHAPDSGWELLALVDQYYRLGKVSEEAFTALKSHLQQLLLGTQARPGGARPPERRAQPRPATATATAPVPEAPLPRPSAPRGLGAGDVLKSRYRIEGLLGRGGMGTVYVAIDEHRLADERVDAHVAIKVLHTEVLARPGLFAELRREFQYLQSLSHPHIVRVHEFDRDGDLAFFTMECLRGALLSEVLPVPSPAGLRRPHALAILRDVGDAIAYAHSRSVVHGDLNPSNVYVTDDSGIRVLDFGASYQLHRDEWNARADDRQQLPVATPAFASCQLLEGEPADPRDDVYALACIAYLLLTGILPYGHHNALEARTLGLSPTRPPQLSRREWQALRAALSFDREARPMDVRAWLQPFDLGAAVAQLPAAAALQPASRATPRRGVRAALLAASALALAGAGVWWAQTQRDDRATGSPEAPAQPQAKPRVAPVPAPAPALALAPTTAPAPPPRAAIQPPTAAPPSIAAQPPAVAANPADGAQPPAVDAAAAVPIRARVEMVADSIDVDLGDQFARVVVHRSRTLRGDVDFQWWTESGTAKPHRDFAPVAKERAQIAAGKNSAELTIPVTADPARTGPRSFYVVIDEPSENAMLGARTLTMVTIPGPQ